MLVVSVVYYCVKIMTACVFRVLGRQQQYGRQSSRDEHGRNNKYHEKYRTKSQSSR